jgi:thioredoxin reductase (NADPH)
MFLSECAEKALPAIRGTDLSKSMSSYLSCRVETKRTSRLFATPSKMTGGKRLEAVELENTRTGERRTVPNCSHC